MIRWLLIALVILSVVVLVAFLMVRDPGYVLVVYENTTVETSLWVGLVLILFSAIAIYLAFRLVYAAFRSQRNYRKWRNRQHDVQLLQHSNAANSAAGDQEARETSEILKRLPASKHQSLLTKVQEAQVHHFRGDYKGRDKLFEQAIETYPKAKDDLILRQLALELSRGFTEARLAKLEKFRKARPRHVATQILYFQTCANWGLYARIKELLPRLRKRGLVSPEELDRVELEIWRSAIDTEDLSNVNDLRRLLPRKLRQNPELLVHFVQNLRANGNQDEALRALEQEIKQDWSGRLVELYGLFRVNPEHQLKTAKGWLKDHTDDASLLLTLARLAVRCGQLDLAREYYENVIRAAPSRDAHMEFADVCLQLGNRELHDSHLRRAEQLLLTATLNSSNLPVALSHPV